MTNVTGPATAMPGSNVYNGKNQDTRTGYNYDAAGNLLYLNGNSATYDAENRLTALTATGGASETILYDAAGQRVQKSYGGSSTVYVYDAFGRLAAEYANGTTWSRDYIFDGTGFVVASENASGLCTTCYFGYDHLGSVRIVMDGGGNVIGRHDFLPFGEELLGTAGCTTAGFNVTNDVTQKFTGQIRDQESGEDFFNARYFTAGLGRFNSADPGNAGVRMGSSQSWNGYGYVLGNPLGLADPTGLDAQCGPNATWSGEGCWGGASGGLASAPSYYNPYQVVGSNGMLVNTGSSLGSNSADLSSAESRYLNNARSVLGWLAGDDPSSILGYVGSDSATQAAQRQLWDIAANGVGNSCASYLGAYGISADAIQSSAAHTVAVSEGDPRLAYLPYGAFTTAATVGTSYMDAHPLGTAYAWAGPSVNTIIVNKVQPNGANSVPSTRGVMIHEMTHISTGMNDLQMMNAFYPSGYNGGNAAWSAAYPQGLARVFVAGGCN